MPLHHIRRLLLDTGIRENPESYARALGLFKRAKAREATGHSGGARRAVSSALIPNRIGA